MKSIGLISAVWLAFAGLCGYVIAVADVDMMAWLASLGEIPNVLVIVDLSIALSLFCVWMWFDVKERGKSIAYFTIFAVLCPALGSLSPLTYLLLRQIEKTKVAEAS